MVDDTAGPELVRRSGRRQKDLQVIPLSGSEMKVIATLQDTSVALDDPDDVEIIHDLRIEATVALPDLVILDIEGTAFQQPYDQCALTAAPLTRLRGVSLTRGYRQAVTEAIGSVRGCTHFHTLAMDLAATNILSIYLRMRAEVEFTPQNRSDGTWARAALAVEPRIMNACMALAADSPVQRRAVGDEAD